MNDLTVDTATLNTVASTYATIAAELGLAGTQLGAGDAELSAVFGVIGSEFVTAVHASTREHRNRIDALADAAQRIGSDLHDAGVGYQATDHTAGSHITASGSGARVA